MTTCNIRSIGEARLARPAATLTRWRLAFRKLALCAAIILLAICGRPVLAQSIDWVVRAGGADGQSVWAVATDSLGNSIAFGHDSNGIFITKYDSSGVAHWTTVATVIGTGVASPRGIATDAAGNSYLTGSIWGTLAFGSTTLANTGSTDIFVAKLNRNGEVLWAMRAGGTDFDSVSGITTDAAGNSYLTGYFTGTANFGNTTLIGAGPVEMFVAKLNSNGVVLWAVHAGGTGRKWASGIATDAAGNSYVAGALTGTAIFGDKTLTSEGADEMFVTKLNSNGVVLWAMATGGTGGSWVSGIALDATGNSYLTGKFRGTASFGNTTLTSGDSAGHMFVTKLNRSGAVLWAISSAGGAADVTGNVIATDAVGNSYVTGSLRGTASFGNRTLTSQGDDDMFVTKLNSSGDVMWAMSAGGTDGDAGYGISFDAAGNGYVGGRFWSTAIFDNIVLSETGRQAFLIKITPPNPRDLNRDGKSDILFQNTAGQLYVWYMDIGHKLISGGYLTSAALAPWKLVGTADLNNDGKADLLFQHATDGRLFVWYMNGDGTIYSSGYFPGASLADWKVVALADLNNDGNADLLFQNNTGQLYVWYMNGAGLIASGRYFYVDALGSWRVVGAPDLNKDGNADLVFQDAAGQVYVWYLDGAGRLLASSGYLYPYALGDWKIVGALDLNSDRNLDIVLQNNAGQLYVWYLNGAGKIVSGGYFSNPLGDWKAVAR